jgi:hypothetical protein
VAADRSVVDPAKVTGMILQLRESQVVATMGSKAALDEVIGQAVDTLRRDALRQLRESVQVLQEVCGKVCGSPTPKQGTRPVSTRGHGLAPSQSPAILHACAHCQFALLCVQTELAAVLWDEIPDGLSTSPFPVTEEVVVRIGMDSPLAVAFAVNVWISRPVDAGPLLAGTICDARPWLTITLMHGSVRLGLSIAEPIPAELAAAASVALPEGRMAELHQQPMRNDAAGARSWADDDTDPEELPSLEELQQAADARRSRPSVSAAFYSDKFDFEAMRVQSQEAVCAFILQRLGESRPVIASAVIANLGVDAALQLLHTAETIQEDGGMLIEESGKKRTVGGIFIKLLREPTDLDQAQANAAWLSIKKDGDAARKAKLQERCQRRKYGERSPRDSQEKRPFVSPRSIETRSANKRKEKFGGVTPANLVCDFSTA